MKKLILLALCVATCLLLTLGALADTQVPGTCQACGTQQTWTVLPSSVASLKAGHYHYYLDKDVTPKQLIMPQNVDVTLCLDLNGHSITTDGRAMYLYSGSVVNLMDSSAGETGYICGSTGSNNTASGTINLAKGSALNLYSGTVKFRKDDVGLGMCRGVVGIQTGATMRMYGGKVEGGELVTGSVTNPGTGGAIYMEANCSLFISGGEITSGIVPDSGDGPCIYAGFGTSKITLTGDARVEEICGVSLKDNLTISGTFAGYARLRPAKSAPPSAGTVVGTLAGGADISGANLFCYSDNGYEVVKSGSSLVLKTFVPTAQLHKCDHCQDIVKWTPYKSGASKLSTAGHYHLYLSERYTGTQINPAESTVLCLDLYGNAIYADGRGFNLKTNVKLNVMDSVGGGSVTGTSSNTNPAGGMMAVGTNAEVNLYGGTFTAIQDGSGYGIGAGGVIYISGAGTVNLYGGTIRGADLVMSGYSLGGNGRGAAIYLNSNSVVNVYGGQILSGSVPAGGVGECLYLAGNTAKVNLFHDGSVEEIYCLSNSKQLTVTGTYTGAANLRFPDPVQIPENTVVGVCVDAELSGARLQCLNGSGYALLEKDGQLITSSFGMDAVAAVYDSTGATGYTTLQAAIDACDGGYIKLMKTGQTATATKDLYIDLNGMAASLTLSEGVTLYGFDSQTDDYTVADGVCGQLTVTGGTVTGLPAAAEYAQDQYLAVQKDGKVSFHRVTLEIYAMSLRPSQAGLYYKSHFRSDEVAAPMIDTYGVALSAKEIPTPENLDTHCKYSVFSGFKGGENGNADTASTMLTGVLKPRNSDRVNASHLQITVYGRAYAKTLDGQLLLGQPVERSMEEQLELASSSLEQLTTRQVDGFIALYQDYESILKDLQLDNLLKIMGLTDTFLPTDLIKDGKTDYVIVYDSTAGAKKLADQLVTIFSNVYGIKLQSYPADQVAEAEHEIVIGMARWISHKAARELTGEFDFAVIPAEGKLLLCGKNDLSYGYMGQYLKREVFVSGKNLTLDTADSLVYSDSELVNTTYIDYWMAGNTSFTLGDHFAYETYTNAATTLPYRIYVPFNYDPAKEYPLIVNLHGAGLRGDNNQRQLSLIDKILKIPEMKVDEAIIIFPQCPENNKWVDTDWNKGSYSLDAVPESNELTAVMELIGLLQQNYSIDSSRIYAMGYSMGGYGTWNLLMNHPDVFAAGIPMCGAGDPTKAEILKDIPIWAVHGAKDPTVPVSGSRDMAKAMEAVGATNFRYTELPDAEHDVWNYTYANQEMFNWLLSQRKAS